MTEFVNNGSERRVWTGIQREDGRTLELDPGETVELDLSARFRDPYLQPRHVKRETKAKAARREKLEADEAKAETTTDPKSEE